MSHDEKKAPGQVEALLNSDSDQDAWPMLLELPALDEEASLLSAQAPAAEAPNTEHPAGSRAESAFEEAMELLADLGSASMAQDMQIEAAEARVVIDPDVVEFLESLELDEGMHSLDARTPATMSDSAAMPITGEWISSEDDQAIDFGLITDHSMMLSDSDAPAETLSLAAERPVVEAPAAIELSAAPASVEAGEALEGPSCDAVELSNPGPVDLAGDSAPLEDEDALQGGQKVDLMAMLGLKADAPQEAPAVLGAEDPGGLPSMEALAPPPPELMDLSVFTADAAPVSPEVPAVMPGGGINPDADDHFDFAALAPLPTCWNDEALSPMEEGASAASGSSQASNQAERVAGSGRDVQPGEPQPLIPPWEMEEAMARQAMQDQALSTAAEATDAPPWESDAVAMGADNLPAVVDPPAAMDARETFPAALSLEPPAKVVAAREAQLTEQWLKPESPVAGPRSRPPYLSRGAAMAPKAEPWWRSSKLMSGMAGVGVSVIAAMTVLLPGAWGTRALEPADPGVMHASLVEARATAPAVSVPAVAPVLKATGIGAETAVGPALLSALAGGQVSSGQKTATEQAAPEAALPDDQQAARDQAAVQLKDLIEKGKRAVKDDELKAAIQDYEEARELARDLQDFKSLNWLRGEMGKLFMTRGEAIMAEVFVTPSDCQEAHALFDQAFSLGFKGERNERNLKGAERCTNQRPPGQQE